MSTKPVSLLAKIITQLIAIAIFVALPIGITLMVPFTDLDIRRTGSSAEVKIKRYLLMFIPWQTQVVPQVTELRAEITAEKRYQDTAENRRKGRVGTSLSTGQLVVVNSGPEIIVQAAPELASKISKQFAEFLVSDASDSLQLSIYANWNLSYILGGAATFFAAFYLAGALIAIVIFPFKLLRSRK